MVQITEQTAQHIITVTLQEMSVLEQDDKDLDQAYKTSKEQLRDAYNRCKNAHDMAQAYLDWTSYNEPKKESEQNGSN